MTDQDRALAFYQDVLGFEVRRDMPFGDGGRWLEVAPPGRPPPSPSWGRTTRSRSASTPASGCSPPTPTAITPPWWPNGADVDAEILRMGEYVPPMFTFRDPDGNTLYIVQGS